MRRALLLLLLASCGDPLADAGYLGTPLAVLAGRAVAGMGETVTPVRPHVGLVWPGLRGFPQVNPDCPDEGGGFEGGPSFYAAAARIDAVFPSTFRIELFDPPPAAAMGVYRGCGGELDGRMAVAFVMAFDDLDDDGTFTEATVISGVDRAIGYSDRHMLLWIDVPPRPGSWAWNHVFFNPEKATRGFHVVEGVCAEGDVLLDRVRILGEDEALEVVVEPVDPDAEIEPRCLGFIWPGGT